MSIFTNTFDKPGTVVQTVTTDPVSRGLGNLVKMSSLATLGVLAISTGIAPIAAVAGAAFFASTYVGGAAIAAEGVKATNKQGGDVSFTKRFVRNLNPFKG